MQGRHRAWRSIYTCSMSKGKKAANCRPCCEYGEKLSYVSEAGFGTCVREPRDLCCKTSEVFSDVNPELVELPRGGETKARERGANLLKFCTLGTLLAST